MVKKLFICIILLMLASAYGVTIAQTSVTKTSVAPFQGTKEFCEFYQKSKYIVTIKTTSVIIKYVYIKENDTTVIKGKIVNGKVYTNNPEEKQSKQLAGRYYLLTKNSIRILNTENGDYDEYDICK